MKRKNERYKFITNKMNKKIVQGLIKNLDKYTEEHGFQDNEIDTLIRDVVYFFGRSINKKYEFRPGYDLFIKEIKEIL